MKRVNNTFKIISLSKIAILVTSHFALVGNANAESARVFHVLPNFSSPFSNIVMDSQVGNTDRLTTTSIYLNVSCYGTNLRAVATPLSPYNDVIANIGLKDKDDKDVVVSVKFPAWLTGNDATVLSEAQKAEFKSTAVLAAPAGTVVSAGDNRLIRINVKNLANIKMLPDGTVDISRKLNFFRSVSFEQLPVSNNTARSATTKDVFGNYVGLVQYSGPISAAVNHSVSADMKAVHIHASFPGAAGFCGGFYSPLMLFFDDKLPDFKNTSNFKINENSKKVYWPESGNNGYFLAMDRNKNKIIDDGYELFGDQLNFTNGFEALKALDSNADLIIDEKDKDFKNLILWNDKNGDGISQKNEIIKLSDKKIISIDLKFKNVLRSFGERADIKQTSFFKYKEKSGKIKEGPVHDIYFNSAK